MACAKNGCGLCRVVSEQSLRNGLAAHQISIRDFDILEAEGRGTRNGLLIENVMTLSEEGGSSEMVFLLISFWLMIT
ncbi:hypothetical protein L207DRAFT_48961 [Hyaloscypha variabilis F]|uniref:Uncharacterized protein n=1 Tax=Hyaloscypha variabilis (strain UAMH 11265 / GT02V1 / F) TaxID=1149755 RepID=A0A2J6RKD9_HYAVF|nr:hypothetical protein L207DRAFT_48961 [Hyaloscypha variabilis F]